MEQPKIEMSGLLAELASEASQKVEAERTQQQDREQMTKNVNEALLRAFQYFTLLSKHLNALQPPIPRLYSLDTRTPFSNLKWKSSMSEYRKQSLADDALMDIVFFQAKIGAPAPIVVSRRWEAFEELRKQLEAYGLKPMADMHDMWRSRDQKVMFQLNVEPDFLVALRFQANYAEGYINISCSNLDRFGEIRGRIKGEALQQSVLDDFGRVLMGRSNTLPAGIEFTRTVE